MGFMMRKKLADRESNLFGVNGAPLRYEILKKRIPTRQANKVHLAAVTNNNDNLPGDMNKPFPDPTTTTTTLLPSTTTTTTSTSTSTTTLIPSTTTTSTTTTTTTEELTTTTSTTTSTTTEEPTTTTSTTTIAPSTTTTSTTTSTTTVALLPLKLNFIDYVPVANPSNVNDWNTYFELPASGNPFTSVTVISPTEYWLYGGSNISLQYGPFGDNDILLSIIDDAGCIIELTNGCFEFCSSLTAVSFPACTYIGDDVFSYDESLVSINVPNVTFAGSGAFYGIAASSLYIPLLESAGDGCFSSCINISSFNLPSLTSAGAFLFDGCSSMTSYSVPLLNWENATSLPVGTFRGCSSMTSFNFPNLQSVNDQLFTDCSSAIISVPNITQIGSYAFQGCTAMTSFSFPLVTSVGDYAFWWCTSATSFNLPVCTNLGGTVTNDSVFLAISGNTITLTIPSALMTCFSGNPDGDIQALQSENTVTVVTV